MKLSIRSLRRSGVGAVALALFSTMARADSPDAGAPALAAQPISVAVLTSSPRTAEGLIFLTPTNGASGAVQGEEIVDGQGRPVWFSPLPSGETAFDLRVQQYHGEPVLTWIQSKGPFSTGPTTDYIADRHYHVIATVSAGHGLTADIHEFYLTREGTALITIYRTVTRDLSSVGGPAAALVTEGVVQEIDIANGNVIFEWSSLEHIGLDESHAPLPTSATTPWDYFHLNAASVDEDGDLLIDARNAWAAYKLDRHTGVVKWRLGGKKSDFVLGPDVAFAWQHNPTAVDDHGLVRIFDNEAAPEVRPYSRVIWVRRNDVEKTATLERWLKHPDGLLAPSQGNAQGLENGDTFVGWGALPRFSEFDERNDLLFDAALPTGYNSYRAYRFEWRGEPDARPTAIAAWTSDGATVVHAIWNGATEVARWDVVGAGGDEDRDDRHRIASAAWNGLDTSIQVGEFRQSVVVVARDRAGRELGRSAVTPVAP
jgi:Arylsulfotransferase (ASST)